MLKGSCYRYNVKKKRHVLRYFFHWVKVELLLLLCYLIPIKKPIIILDGVVEMKRLQIEDLVSAVFSKSFNKIAWCSAHDLLKSATRVTSVLQPHHVFMFCRNFLKHLQGTRVQNNNVALIGMVMNAEAALCRLLPDGYVMSNSTSWGTLCFEWSRQKQKVVVRLSTTPWKSFLIKAPPCPFIIPLYIIRMLQLSVPIRPAFFHANQFDSITIC